MEDMAPGPVSSVHPPSRANKAAAALAWAAMGVGGIGLLLIIRIYVAFGEVSGASWGSAWALLVGAIALAGVAGRLRPPGVRRHDFVSIAVVVTYLCIGIAVLVTAVLAFALATDG